jgi:hypothetical protein
MNSDDLKIEVLATGSHDGKMNVSTETLDALVRNHALLKGRVQPMLRVGEGARIFAGHDEDADPSLGVFTELKRAGSKLIGTLSGCPSVVRDAVRKGLYTRISARLYPEWSKTSFEANLCSGAVGPVLHSVAVEGWQPPIVRTLQDLNKFLNAEVDAGKLKLAESDDGTVTLSLRCAEPPNRENHGRIDSLARDLAELTQDNRELAARANALVTGDKNTMTENKPRTLAEGGFRDGTKLIDPHLALSFLTALERYIAEIGADPLNIAHRREAARETLKRWWTAGVTGAASLETSDYSACIERAALPDGPVTTPRPKWPGQTGGVRPAIGPAQPLEVPPPHRPPRPAAIAKAMSDTGDVPEWGYQDANVEARRLGGADRYEKLRDVAKREGLSLTRTHERARAEALLFAELGGTVASARCQEEAHHAALRRLGADRGGWTSPK